MIRWRKEALADLEKYSEWLATIERAKPRQTIGRIRAAANSMRRLGDIGRPTKVKNVRALSVRNAPYVVLYMVDEHAIEIVAVYHTAQDR